MSNAMLEIHSGLEGIYVASTQLSRVDGMAGSLIYRGYDIGTLAGQYSFEAVADLLWNGQLSDGEALRIRLADGRLQAHARLLQLQDHFQKLDAMSALRYGMGSMSSPDYGGDPAELTAAMAVFVAGWIRLSRGLEPLQPRRGVGHAQDFRYLVTGDDDEALAKALEAYLVTVMDHGMNASTFTARVVASTGSDLVSALTGALGSLKGPLHGGAPGPVLDMLDAIGRPDQAEPWLRAELEAGRRVMGMGHRVYRVRDPRAQVLSKQVTGLGHLQSSQRRLNLAEAVEACAEGILSERYPQRNLRANVEFYTAVLLEAVGLPREAFCPTFAVARVVGWCAHVKEQRETGRLIRPKAAYQGPMPQA